MVWKKRNLFDRGGVYKKEVTMVLAIGISAKRQPQYTYVVRAEDWLNPDLYCVDAQDPYTGEAKVIHKHMYKIGWVIDENGESNYSF
jgi:hypothetical protein